ncbi:MAG: ATP-binding cassette domain-containing protein [Eubacteriales bacterium]|nr:ATP-binding cassette domain-containing protein [Eubacteriales bacterium]
MSLQVSIKKKLKNFELSIDFDTNNLSLSSGGRTSGILGASGCGKSMTLKCIAGIETPDSGRIVLDGRVFFDSEKKINLKVQDRHVGYLFQNYALFPNMTVEENIRMGTRIHRDKSNMEHYMKLLHIEELKDSYPSRLSGGQQQRVALARMLISKPEILMLDEPFSALDSYLKEKLQLELLELLSQYDKDVLMVSHNRDEIYLFCNEIYVLEEGKVVASGNTKEVFKNPKTVAAAKLTGCKNIIEAKRIDEHTLHIPKWNVNLNLKCEIPLYVQNIGIRAHYLKKAKEEEVENVIEVKNGKIMDDPFEIVAVFENDIWWKTSKEEFYKEYNGVLPKRLVVPESHILFLK